MGEALSFLTSSTSTRSSRLQDIGDGGRQPAKSETGGKTLSKPCRHCYFIPRKQSRRLVLEQQPRTTFSLDFAVSPSAGGVRTCRSSRRSVAEIYFSAARRARVHHAAASRRSPSRPPCAAAHVCASIRLTFALVTGTTRDSSPPCFVGTSKHRNIERQSSERVRNSDSIGRKRCLVGNLSLRCWTVLIGFDQ